MGRVRKCRGKIKSTMNEAVRKVLKRLHYPIEVMLVCVRWYAAYPLSDLAPAFPDTAYAQCSAGCSG